MRRVPLFVVLAVAVLAAAPHAHAGGFATAGLSSTPDGVAAGQPWTVDITVLQHGRTPTEGLSPLVRIESGDAQREFAAKPTGEPGVYRAEVVFPAGGSWSYVVLDGFNNELPHEFPAVEIAGATTAAAPATTAAPDDGGGLATGWLWGAGAALLLAVGVIVLDRRRRPGAPQPA